MRVRGLTLLASLLAKTGAEASDAAKAGSAELQAEVSFLLSKLKKKDHRALIRHIEQAGELDVLRSDFETYRHQPVETLAQKLKAEGQGLTLSALITIVFILQSVAAGEPLKLDFKQAGGGPADHDLDHDDDDWLIARIEKLTDEKLAVKPSEWAESKRYLSSSVTSVPGFYSFDVAPYLKEILDCLAFDTSIREIDFMKGAQIGATVGVLENFIGYLIEHIKSAPVMLMTADSELAQIRVDKYIIPMLQHSGLVGLIQSSDESNKRKTGKTKTLVEWVGGGFLLPFGAKNADKLRSVSIKVLLQDEVDTFPDKVGRDGDPQKLAEARTKAFYDSRKIMRTGTPLVKGSSRIYRGYKKGDQRHFYVPCKSCGEEQVLEFQGGRTKADDTQYGLVWDMDDGELVKDSVRYLCKHCQHPHRNSDKAWMLPRGRWVATAKPKDSDRRSYQLSALYSPIGFYPWEAVVSDWLEAWDIESDSVKDVGLLQEFYNNVLGRPFVVIGSRVRLTQVSAHRRAAYRLGEIPNAYASEYAGSIILFVTCQVDVHKRNLAVATMGWTRDTRCFVIDYWRFEVKDGEEEATEVGSPVWSRLEQMLETTRYVADDGRVYSITLTLVDAGYAHSTVTEFCAAYSEGVYPILGRERPSKSQKIREFAPFKTQKGTCGYNITVDHYKDRLAPVLRREWSENAGRQKVYHFNAPADIKDKALKELTVEIRSEKLDAHGNLTQYWHRPGNVANELWDLLVYGHAAVDILAWSICIQHFELETIDWHRFWDYIESEKLYFTEPEG
jgi:phage terminase large subunit GpA-like protein